MPVRIACTYSVRRNVRHTALFAGVSAVALFMASPEVYARPLGGWTPAPSAAAVAASQSGALEASRAARQAQNSLKRATLAIQAMQATQAAARDAARAALGNSGVPNGLGVGGLQVAPQNVPANLWQGANLPTQFTDGDRTKVNIEQTQQKAILTWDTFHVGGKTDLNFNQKGNRDWVALNRVLGTDAKPSQILGNIKADGQVYIINQNGIIFGGASQVNVGTLIASSLSLSNEQFVAGINKPLVLKDAYGYETVYLKPQFGEYTNLTPNTVDRGVTDPSNPWFTPSYGNNAPGGVTVEKGAQIAASGGGKVMLFAPKVTNAGTLAAPDGQVIMAAGENVWLSSIPSNASEGTVPHWLSPVRGLEVAASAVPVLALGYNDVRDAIGANTPYPSQLLFSEGMRDIVLPMMEDRARTIGYQVTNTGHVEVQRGDITLAGPKIVQAGTLLATSALNNREGSIRIQGWSHGFVGMDGGGLEFPTMIHWAAGEVTLTPGSLTTVMPDLTDTSELELGALATRYRPGRIEVRGEFIDVQSDASLIVPGGEISILATSQPVGALPDDPAGNDASLRDGSRIYIDSGAYLSAAGLQDVLLPMDINFVEATLGINELRDSPLYKDSWLRGLKVVVDRRVNGKFEWGPMGGVTWMGDDKAGQWVGTPLADVSAWVALSKTNIKELSTVGGKISLKAGGSIITRAGSVLDVSGGSVRYEGGWIHTTKLLTASGHVVDISEATPDMNLIALAVGFTRHHARWGVTETWTSPLGKERRRFEPGYAEGRNAGAITMFAGEAFVLEGGIWAGTVIGERQNSPVTASRGGSLTLGGGSNEDFAFSPGHIVITDNPTLLANDFAATDAVPAHFYEFHGGSSYSKTAWLSDDMLSESGLGKINLFVSKSFSVETGTDLRLAPGASLSVAPGTLSPVEARIDGLIRAPGGSVNIASVTTHLGPNAVIDVSGEWINPQADGSRGNAFAIHGGSISINNLAGAAQGAILDVSGGAYLAGSADKPKLSLGNAGSIALHGVNDAGTLGNLDLRAYAAGSGGSLTLQTANAVQIGGNAADSPGALHLAETLFADSGFRSVTISGQGGVTVADGAEVSLIPLGIRLTAESYSQASGRRITDLGTIETLRPEERLDKAPASLVLTGGNILIRAGAHVSVDTAGAIQFGGESGSILGGAGNVTVLGTVEAPAGSITVNASGTIRLADGGRLIARGVPAISRGAGGLRTGSVLAGGTVSLTAQGAVSLEAGSLIDVSGAAGEIDLPLGGLSGPRSTPLTLSSNGGLISIKSPAGVIEGTLAGRAGGDGALGGRLSIQLDGPAGTGGPSLVERILATLAVYDPNCPGDSVCGNPQNAIGYDLGLLLEGWGYPEMPEMILTQALMDKLAPGRSEFILSETAPAPAVGSHGPLDPTAFGLTPEALDAFRDFVFYSDVVRDGLQSPPRDYVIVARPSSFASGGFADVTMQSSAAIKLDGVDISAGRSITLLGASVSNFGVTNSALRASLITLGWGLRDAETSPSIAGRLTLSASLIEIVGNGNIRGFADTVLQASDIRLAAASSAEEQPTAMFDTQGTLTLKAAQIYPATATQATIRAAGMITIEANGDAPLPLSAGGSLTLEAPVIEQNGVLRAPFGSITFKASDRVTLGAGSITSVSGAGLILPYGQLLNNEFWTDPTKPQTNGMVDLTAPPEKRITLDALNVKVAEGSVLDVRGGGDLFAWEFVAGTGGSHDVLTMPGAFAIMPAYTGSFAPDASGKRIWLAGGNGLAAGWYTALPARYAMLPGAYVILPGASSLSAQPASSRPLNDGSQIVSGYLGDAFSSARDPAHTSWQVMSGDVLRRYSEYNEALASEFFASDAFRLTQYRRTGLDIAIPRLPTDAGALVLKAAQSLMLEGQLQMQAAAGGRGGLLDVAAAKIAIIGADQGAGDLGAQGYLVLDSAMLTNAGAGSLLIGGVRSGTALGMGVDVVASDIVVHNSESSRLAGVEIILAASGNVTLRAGSVIAAEGEASGGAVDLVMKPQVAATTRDPDGWDDGNPADDVIDQPARDWGALIRLSNAGDARVMRAGIDMSQGGVAVLEAGAVLRGGKSLTIDATRSTSLAASAVVSGKNLTLGGGRIGFGGGTEGLIFDEQALAQLASTENLRLRSYSTIDFHRTIDFGGAGLGKVTLDAAGFVGVNGNDVTLRAGILVLENTASTATNGSNAGAGTLNLHANDLVLGTGAKTIGGFAHVQLNGATRVLGDGTGSLNAGAAGLTIVTPLFTANDGAAQSIITTGALALTGGEGAAANTAGGYGARLSLTGGSIIVASRMTALGGAVNLTATSGDLVLGANALIDVGGFAKQFFDVNEYADAGSIGLIAVGGSVRMDTNAALKLSAHAGGGNAGRLAVTASGGGTVSLDGRIAAQAGRGGKGGAFALDIATLGDFAGLNQQLNTAGFFASRQFRVRNGDVVVDGITNVADFALVADQGTVVLAGTIDARTTYGGRIAISGGNGVVMESSALLMAGATDAKLGSGRVTLEASGGKLDVRDGTIDVAGGEGGKARFRALQTANHDGIMVDRLSATIIGARSTVLEGVSVYDANDTLHGSAFDGTNVDSVKADAVAHANTFAGHAGSIAAGLGLGQGITIAAGVEVRGAGDLTLNSDWNLFADFASQREGTLTLRAAGNLIVNGHISDGFDAADRSGMLQDSASWDIRLVAGADLASANKLALTPLAGLAAGKGTLTVGSAGNGKLVRTGTGDIELSAGRDIVLADKESSIYTAGRKDMTVWADFVNPSDPADASKTAVYAVNGGSLRLVAQGSVDAAPTDQQFTEWLRRRGAYDDYTKQLTERSTWWIDYSQFMGVGVLGGGNLAIEAGGDLDNLVAVLPTNARLRGGLPGDLNTVLEMRNGGAFDIKAGGAIRAGQYYIGRGAGTIEAGEMAIGRTTTLIDQNNRTVQFDIAPIVGLGDATLDVRIQGNLRLETIVDPLMITMPAPQYVDYGAYMSGYTNRTALRLVSIGGDLTLVDRESAADFIFRDKDQSNGDFQRSGLGVNLYPALTHIAALNGSVILKGPIYAIPAPLAVNAAQEYVRPSAAGVSPLHADFRLLAGDSLVFAPNQDPSFYVFTKIVLSRATPGMIPSVFGPRSELGGTGYFQIDLLNQAPWYGSTVRNPDVLPLAQDYEPSRIYALEGSVVGFANDLADANLVANEQIWVRAGKDIRDINYDLRNNRPADVSIISANNDVIGGSKTGAGIVIEGPGQLLISAGRDIFAPGAETKNGVPFTITTVGNQRYFSGANEPLDDSVIKGLPNTGASVTLMAGLNGKEPDYAAFAAAYLDPANLAAMPDYLKTTLPDGTVLPIYLTDLSETRPSGVVKVVRSGVTSFIKEMTGETLSPSDAWARFQSLPESTRQRFVREVYMQELRMATRDQLTPDAGGQPLNGGYNRGYEAIAKLFPGDTWKGDVLLADGSIRTMQGGDIDVLVPGGSLQVAALGQAPADGRGLITLGNPGDIRIFVDRNVYVNRGRVLTFAGGDEIVWATNGDIDAGRGARTARSYNRPLVETDKDGMTTVVEKADISGSGMGTVEGVAGIDPDVDLGAPRGTVNAGDAGIRVGGNLNLAALYIVNAGNIEVSGTSKGVPVVEAPNIGGLTEASNVAGAAAQQAVTPGQGSGNAQPSIIIVEVLGFGGGSGETPDNSEEERRRRGQGQRSYNTNSAVQYVGAGTMSDEQKRRLIENGAL